MPCPVCNIGEFEDRVIERWLRKGQDWVLVRNIPARVCNSCGETTFAQEVAERIGDALLTGTPRTGRSEFSIYDLNIIAARTTATVDPVQSGTTLRPEQIEYAGTSAA